MKNRNVIVCILISSLIMLLAATTGCAPAAPTAPAVEKEPIKIALLMDLTSAANALISAVQQEGAEMAVEDINKDGGVLGRNLELVIADTKTDPTMAISAAKRLKAEGAVAVLTSSSTDAIALAKWALDEGEIPVYGTHGAADVLADNPWAFRTFNMETSEGSAAKVGQLVGKSKMGVLYVNVAYGTESARIIQEIAPEYQVEIVGTQGFNMGATDANVQVQKLKESGAEVVTLEGWADMVAAFARAMEATNWHPIFTAHVGNVVSGMIIVGPDLLEGCITRTLVDYERQDVKDIFDRYEERTGKRRDDDPLTNAYSAITMFAQAIQQAGDTSNPAAIRDAMYEVEFTNLLLGDEGQIFTFTQDKNWLLSVDDYNYMVLKDGTFVPFK